MYLLSCTYCTKVLQIFIKIKYFIYYVIDVIGRKTKNKINKKANIEAII